MILMSAFGARRKRYFLLNNQDLPLPIRRFLYRSNLVIKYNIKQRLS